MTNEKWNEIYNTMMQADANSYRYPCCEYRVYIDTNGDVNYEEWLAGDNAWYQFHGEYDREYIHTFCNQHWDILWDYWFNNTQEFNLAFENQFGFKPENETDRSLYSDGAEACEEHGIPLDDYDEWLDKQTETAIDSIQSETDYDEFIDIWLERRD